MIQIPSPELIKKYDRPGPRYPSYPTVPEWSNTYVPWVKPNQRLLPPEALPTREQRVDLFLAAAEILRVTSLGQLLVRNVAMLFDAYLTRHGSGEAPVFSRMV